MSKSYSRAWRTVPPGSRLFAIVDTASEQQCRYRIAQWEPRLLVWVCENGTQLDNRTLWHPLPRLHSASTRVYALEDLGDDRQRN